MERDGRKKKRERRGQIADLNRYCGSSHSERDNENEREGER